jgi:small subunit ribosomal protein S13
MLYLLETELKENININIAITNIFGISNFKSKILCKKLGLSENIKINGLTKNQKFKLTKAVESCSESAGLFLKQSLLLKRKTEVEIKSYKGLRKLKGYPIRGQRTRTNSKTAKKKLN